MLIFYKLIRSLRVCVARRAQSIQNYKFSKSLEYRKENVNDKMDFSLADKPQRSLQIDIIILGVCGKACPNYPK